MIFELDSYVLLVLTNYLGTDCWLSPSGSDIAPSPPPPKEDKTARFDVN